MIIIISIIFLLLFLTLPYLIYIFKLKFIKNILLRISCSWLMAQFSSSMMIFLIACLLSIFTSNVLLKATIIYISLLTIFIAVKYSYLKLLKFNWQFHSSINYKEALLIILCFLFSYRIYSPHLSYQENKIYTSTGYWDFNIHYPIIQNFVFGDNFPPQNESFSGVPMTYHFYFDFLTAIYESLGLGLAESINLLSVLSFTFLLISLIGFSQEIFKSYLAGLIVVLLTLSSSSLHFIDYFLKNNGQPFRQIIQDIVFNNQHPYFFSFIEGNKFGYNGTMFNIFYFIAERQIIFGALFLIFSLVILSKRTLFSSRTCFLFGLLMGFFFQWHLFIEIMIGASVLFLLFFAPDKKKTFYICAGFGIIFVLNIIYFKSLLKPEWFYPEISSYPRINFNFPTMNSEYPFSILNAFKYYLFAYGFKIFFLISGLIYLFKKDRNIFWLVNSIFVPTFILINTVQLSPLSVYDNHKWLKPMNIIIDLIVALVIAKLFLVKRGIFLKIIAGFSLVLITISGLMELVPFLNSKPSHLYAIYPSSFSQTIRNNTNPKSVFLSVVSKEIHLAGRKLFLGNSEHEPGAITVIDSNLFNKNQRQNIINNIYLETNLLKFCQLLEENKIDFLEFTKNPKDLSQFSTNQPVFFKATTENGQQLYFVDIKKTCQ